MIRSIALSIIVIGSLSLSSMAQNEVGAFLFPQTSMINNKANGTYIYQHVPTISWGGGVNFLHFFSGSKKQGNNKFATLSKRYGLRTGIIYSAHRQKWKAKYQINEGVFADWEGKKRLDYIKLPILFEYSHPLSRKMNYIFYLGPQISILARAQGGIITWKHYGGFDYFDLPAADRKYFKSFVIETVVGAGVDYHITRWINVSASARADISATSIENNNVETNGYKPYDIDKDRGDSHNMSIAILFGIEYKLHKSFLGKTKY